MHSTTCRRQAKKIEASIALDQRVKDASEAGEHYTDADREVAENLEAAELWREFLAEEF